MTKTEDQKENTSSPALIEKESYKKTVADFNKVIESLKQDNSVLQDDVAEKDSTILRLTRERDAEKSRRVNAENIINTNKKLDNKGYEQTKQEQFEDRFAKKWDNSLKNKY